VIRKRLQIDSLNELPKEKRPPNNIIWDGTSRDLENWLDTVFNNKKPPQTNIFINEDEIER
jgi:hypothetical protein